MSSPDDLRVWQAAIQIAVRTRHLVERFPRRGYAELRDQMTRSAESIGINIAEGRSSEFHLEYAKFLDTAIRSAGELSSQLTTAMAYRIVPYWEAFNLNGTVMCTRRMIESLRDHVRAEYAAEQKRITRQPKRSKKRQAPPESV
jgi:four helix bundle protein